MMSKNKFLIGAVAGVCSLGAIINTNIYAKEEKINSIAEGLDSESGIVENTTAEKVEVDADKAENQELGGINEVDEKDDDIENEGDLLSEQSSDNIAKGKSLQDVSIVKDGKLPNKVGIDASGKNNLKDFPLLPGFHETSNGIAGKVPNSEETEIEICKMVLENDGKYFEYYVLYTSSDILSDKTLQSYIRNILSFYSGQEYTVDVGGAEALISIKGEEVKK